MARHPNPKNLCARKLHAIEGANEGFNRTTGQRFCIECAKEAFKKRKRAHRLAAFDRLARELRVTIPPHVRAKLIDYVMLPSAYKISSLNGQLKGLPRRNAAR